MTSKRYYAEKFLFNLRFDGIPAILRVRVLLDRETNTVRGVRTLQLLSATGERIQDVSNLPYLDDIEVT